MDDGSSPSSLCGILRGCISIARGKIVGESDLDHAARAGALCAVSRTKDWMPKEGGNGVWIRSSCGRFNDRGRDNIDGLSEN